MDWSGGYVVDTLCSPGFYRETAPGYLAFSALLAGYAVPPAARAIELGCGIGFNAAVLAAADPGCAWTAVDFNPDHIAAAAAFAARAGLATIAYADASFAELRAAPVEPCDLAVLHGIYSWIDEETARSLGVALRDALAVGGVAYLSYNCLPGWSAAAPLRRLLVEHARRGHGASAARATAAVDFARSLAEGGAGFFAGNPAARARLDGLAGQDPRYLAHEYLNAAWRPLYHADLAAELAGARLVHLGSADPVEAFPDLILPAPLRALCAAEPDRRHAETLLDFAVNRAFRRDLFGRGRVALTESERVDRLLATPLATLVYPDDVRPTARAPLGEAEADPALARRMVDRLWSDGPLPLGAFQAPLPDLLRTVAVLVHGGQVHPARPVTAEARAVARRFNAAVCDDTARGMERGFLAAPGIASGVPAGALEQAVYRALHDDPQAGDAALAEAVQPVLEARRLSWTAEEARHRLRLHRDRKVPLWRALGVL